MKRLFLTDTEVASVLEVSVKTLYRMLKGFHSRGTIGGKEVDLSQMRPFKVNGVRRWRLDAVARALGIGEERIMERIS